MCFCAVINAFGQSTTIASINEAFKAGSAKELAKYLHQTVDLTIEEKTGEEKSGNYSKAQAELVLRDFFKAHTPSEFTIIHQGASKGGQPFAIGKYTSGSDSYRIWMQLKVVNKEQLIQEMKFVKE